MAVPTARTPPRREHGAPVSRRDLTFRPVPGRAAVIGWSKYCPRLLSADAPDPCRGTPIILDEVKRKLGPHGLRFGPEPGAQGDFGHMARVNPQSRANYEPNSWDPPGPRDLATVAGPVTGQLLPF